MRRFRKIIVEGIEYKWLFRYDGYDYIKCCYLLIIMTSSPQDTLCVYFPIKEHFLLNSGLPATFKGRDITIDLNQPYYISQIIHQCIQTGVKFEKNKYIKLNGLEILQKIGYHIPSAFLDNL